MKYLRLLLIAATGLFGGATQADDQIFTNRIHEVTDFSDNHIEAASGVKVGTYHTPRIVVGVRWAGWHEDGVPRTGWRLFALSGNVGMDPTSGEKGTFVSYDFSVTPLTYIKDLGPEDGYLTFNFGHTTKFQDKDTHLAGFTIKVISAGIGIWEPNEERGGMFVNAIVSALGYSMAQRFDAQAKDRGLYIGGINMEGGHEWTLEKYGLPKHIRFRASGHMNFEGALTHLRAHMYAQAALVSRGEYAESSLFVKAGGVLSTFFELDDKVYNGDLGGGFVMAGLNLTW